MKKGRLRAKSRAFSAVALRHAPAGAVATPFSSFFPGHIFFFLAFIRQKQEIYCNLSPFVNRRPAAQALPSMGLLPSGTTSRSVSAPDAQATFSGFVLNISPGAPAAASSHKVRSTFTFFPPYSKYATGHGFKPDVYKRQRLPLGDRFSLKSRH